MASTSSSHLANYLSDLWIFDMNELKWKQIEYLDKDRAPGYVAPLLTHGLGLTADREVGFRSYHVPKARFCTAVSSRSMSRVSGRRACRAMTRGCCGELRAGYI